jgi:mono/diheme cytochrome c family protein
MAHFADHCAPCHGNDSSGDTLYGKGLYPKPPDLRLAERQKLSDGELFWIIENGIRFTGMPAFGGSHGSQDDWKLVLFIRHLPQLTMEERVEMERDNPKGPLEHEKDQEEQEFLGGAPVQQKPESAHHH